MIAAQSNDLINEKFIGKALRSITRNTKEIRIIAYPANRKVLVSFKNDEVNKANIKNFKGLFYWKYGVPLRDVFEIQAMHDEDKSGTDKSIIEALTRTIKFPEIIRYSNFLCSVWHLIQMVWERKLTM